MPSTPDLQTSLLSALSLVALSAGAAAQDPPSEESIEFYRLQCASCHTIGGGPLVGPDLKGLSDRQERDWLVEFMLDPKGMIDSGDPYAVRLLEEARGVYMTPVPGMTEELANKLLDLIDVEGAKEQSQFAGLQLDDRPLTENDVERGRRLFVGHDAFAAGSPACLSCHDVAGLPALGGGRLGPDLTHAYSRLEGRKALGAWLSSPPSAVMQPLYRDAPIDPEEILALIAYLESQAEEGVDAEPSSPLLFVLLGIGLAAFLLILLDVLWRSRFRSVRRTLLAQS